MNIRDYWDKKILVWEDSMSKNQKNVPPIEKLASFFREALKKRSEIIMNMLHSFVQGKTVLELGCGSGFFAFELFEKVKPKHFTGIDIAQSAIMRAQKIAAEKQLADKLTFIEDDGASIKLPEVDVTIGLGFLDYLAPEEIKSLFRNIRSSSFVFTFSERRVSLLRYIHMCYMSLQRCPKHFYYTKNEIASYIGKEYGDVQFFSNKKISFGCIVHNLGEKAVSVLA